MSGVALNPQSIIATDYNLIASTLTTATGFQIPSTVQYNLVPPYQNVSSGNYTVFINSQSDFNIQTTNKGFFSTIGYFNYSTVADTLIGSSNGQFMFQTKNDFNYFPMITRTSPFTTQGYSIAYNGSLYVAAGFGSNLLTSNTIATSVDGIAWNPRGNSVLTTNGFIVSWSGSTWLVGGTSGGASNTSNIAVSVDGNGWVGVNSFIIPTFGSSPSIVWGGTSNGAVMTVPNSGVVFTSPTGSIWTARTPGVSYPSAIAWNGYLFVATTNNFGVGNVTTNNVITSTDGITWVTRTTNASFYPFGVGWSPTLGIWVVSGYGGGVVVGVWYSYNGISWTVGTGAGTSVTYYDIAWNGTYFMIAPQANTQPIYSTNGIAWSNGTIISAAQAVVAIGWINGTWVAGGTTSMFYLTTSGVPSGAWSTSASTPFSTRCWDIKPNNGTLLVAVGQGTATTIAYSSTGITWTNVGGVATAGATSATSQTTFTTAGYDVCWATELGLWIAVGQGINRVLTSPDAINWTARDGPGIHTSVYGAAWSPFLNQWALAGIGNATLATSSDLLGFNTNATAFTTQGWCVIWSSLNNFWLAGGAGTNVIATSTDGISWVPRTSANSLLTAVYSLGFNGSLYVAVGTTAGTTTIAYSSDGVTWTGVTSSSSIFSAGRSVKWSSALNLWIAVGAGTYSTATSSNGTTWAGGVVIASSAFTTSGYDLVATPTQIVAVGAGGNTIATSRDGVIFTGMNQTIYTILSLVFCIGWNGQIWVAGGSAGSTPSVTLASSPDGILWTVATGTVSTTSTRGVAWNGNYWMSIGIGGNIFCFSTNGSAWTGLSTPAGGTNSITTGYGITWWAYGSLWIGCGVTYYTTIRSSSPTNYGTTGANLTYVQTTAHSMGTAWAIASYRALIVMVGGATNPISTSINGTTFTRNNASTPTYTTGGITTAYGVAYSPTLQRWVIVGSGSGVNNIIYSSFSTQTQVWTGNNVGFNNAVGTNIFTTQGLGVIWNGSYFAAVGNGTNILATSADGITWRTVAPTNSTTIWNCIAYRPPTLVGTGNTLNRLCYSLDRGYTWIVSSTQPFTGIVYCVAWNGSIWVAGGLGTYSLAYSYNGITWTAGLVLASSVFTTQCNDVLWADALKLWVAVGSGTNSIATSIDGINWTARSLIISGGFAGGAQRLGWNGTTLIALGDGNNNVNSVAYSTNGTAWIFVGTPITYLGTYGGVAWNGLLWVAVSDNATNIWSSPNGITWTSRATLSAGNCRHVAWNGSQFLVIGTSTYCATSPDGITWTQYNTQPITTFIRATWNFLTQQWMVAGTTPAIYMTTNGQSWTQTFNSMQIAVPQANYTSFTWAPQQNLWLMTGGASYNITYSPDGSCWTNSITTGLVTGYCVAYAYVAGTTYWIAGGGNLTTNTMYTSTDGINWVVNSAPGHTMTRVNSIVWCPTLFIWVAAGTTGVTGILAYCTVVSGTGANWAVGSSTVFTSSAYSVAVNNALPLFVAVGQGTNTSAGSANGTTWTSGGATGITTQGSGIVWSPSMALWIAVGTGTNSIMTSAATTAGGVAGSWTGYTTTTIFSTSGYQIATNYNPQVPLVGGITITSLYGNGTTVTYTTTGIHGLTVGQAIYIIGLYTAGYNGAYSINAVPTTSSFTVTNTTVQGVTAGLTGMIYTQISSVFITTITPSSPSTGFVTFTTGFGSVPHGLAVRQNVIITGLVTAGYNTSTSTFSPFPITTVGSTTQFSVPNTTTGGTLTSQSGIMYIPLASYTITVSSLATLSSQVAYITTAPHGLAIGQVVILSGFATAGYNGQFTITVVSSRDGVGNPITSLVANGTTVVYTTTVAHGLAINQGIVVSGLVTAGYNGTFVITAVATTTFTVTNATTGGTTTGLSGTFVSNSFTVSNATTGGTTTGLVGTIFTPLGPSNTLVATGAGINALAYSYNGSVWNGLLFTVFPTSAYGVGWNSTTGQWIAGSFTQAAPYYATCFDGVNWIGRGSLMTGGVYAIGYQLQREKTYTITNTQWTGRSTTQNFRILSA